MVTTPLDTPTVLEPLDGVPTADVTVDVDSVLLKDQATLVGLVSDTTPSKVVEEALVGSSLTIDKAKADSVTPIEPTLQGLIKDSVDPEDLRKEAEDLVVKSTEAIEAELSAETIIGKDSKDFTATDLRYLRRSSKAESIISDELRKNVENKSFLGKAGDFLDRYFVRQVVVGTYEDFTNRTGRLGEELQDLALDPSISDEQHADLIRAKVAEMKEEGFFTDENMFALAQLHEASTNQGFNPNEGVDKAFAVLDVVGGTAVSKAVKLSKTTKAVTPIQKAVALEGVDKASTKAGTLATKTDNPEILDDILPPHESYGNKEFTVNQGRVRKILAENKLAQEVQETLRKGVAGRPLDETEILAKSTALVRRVSENINRPVSSYNILSGPLDNKVLDMRIGTIKTGEAFKTEKSAQRVASKIDGAKVYEEDGGYFVSFKQNVDLSGSDKLNTDAVFSNHISEVVSKITGSNPLRDMERLSVLSQMGESAAVAFKRAAGPQLKAVNKLKNTDRVTLGKVYSELRDGSLASQRDHLSPSQFREQWIKASPSGAEPTQKQIEAYEALVDMSDTAWLIEASEALQTYTRNGFTSAIEVTSGSYAPARKIAELTEEVLNDLTPDQKALVGKGHHSVWRLESDLPDGSKYVVDPTDVRLLEYEDVHGFNAGGRRANQDANYFVMLAGEGQRPKAMLTAFTEKKAQRASDELNSLSLVRKAGKLTDEIVADNNSWNPDIDTVAKLEKLIADKGWDLTRPILHKQRDQPLETLDVDNPFAGQSAEKFFRNDGRRQDEVLMEYGGAGTVNDDPVQAITDQFGTASRQIAQRAYALQAIDSWLNTAKEMPSIKLDPALSNSPRTQFLEAKITGTSPSDARMKELRSITRRRLSVKSDLELGMEHLGQTTLEAIDDKFGKKVKIPNVEGALMNVAFKTAFGFFNLSQFVMQSAHATAIMAIAPVHGTVGVGRTIPMRMLLNVADSKAQKEATRRFAQSTRMKLEDAEELVEYIKSSARDVLDGDVAEAGTGVGYGVSGWRGESYLSNVAGSVKKGAGKALDASLIPFNQGERLARMVAINTAYAEFKANPAHKGMSALSDYGRQWITRREQTLGFNMTTGSRPLFQSGVAKIPTQWMSYSFRAMEAIAFGTGGLTVAQRARLFAVLGPMYGMTGMGLASASDYMSESLGLDPKDDLNDLIRFGLVDYTIGEVTGAETALGDRLAPLTILPDIYKDITEGSLVEAVAGPSGQIASGIVESVMETVGDIYHGRPVSMTEDVIRVLRQPSSIDKLFGAYGVYNNGVYRSKDGVKFEGEMSPSDTVQLLFGFTPAQQVEIRQRRNEMYIDDKTFKTFRKELVRDSDKAVDWLTSSDPEQQERGLKLLKELHVQISRGELSEKMKNDLRRAITMPMYEVLPQLQKQYVDRNRLWAAQRVEEITRGNN